MSDYDPFRRGPHPVGVRSFELVDADRDGRRIPVEVWYPTTAEHNGQDLDPATQDSYELLPGLPPSPQDAIRDAPPLDDDPLTPIIFSHGFAGHRRQTTHLCTHLASHGYAVASPDHLGNTTADVMSMFMGGGMPDDLAGYIDGVMRDRPLDAQRTLDALLAGELGVRTRDDGAGMSGHSFGGWTTITTTARDRRIVSALPLAPAGGKSAVGFAPANLSDLVELDWGRDVPTLMITADQDSVLPIDGMHDLLARADGIDRMVMLINADHFHFCDRAEIVHDMMAPLMGGQAKPSADFIPGAEAYDVTNGLGLIHFDATLRKLPEAIELAEQDPTGLLAARDITVEVFES